MIFLWIVFALVAMWIGSLKNRPIAGCVLGLLLGIFGVLIILFVPAKIEEKSQAQ